MVRVLILSCTAITIATVNPATRDGESLYIICYTVITAVTLNSYTSTTDGEF